MPPGFGSIDHQRSTFDGASAKIAASSMTSSPRRQDAWLYTFTIFVSAFLLFQVQPIIAKMILPWFGGTSAVWNTCMLFFQMVLLLGYLYAHWIHRMPPLRQAILHTALLALSLSVLPGTRRV
jgi:hypothetical protein